jgi:hypothetical protein
MNKSKLCPMPPGVGVRQVVGRDIGECERLLVWGVRQVVGCDICIAVATCANASEYYRPVAGKAQPSPVLSSSDYKIESPDGRLLWCLWHTLPQVFVCVCVFVDAK